MKILSIDTSSDICGVSILEDNNLIDILDNDTGRTHSENLMPMIKKILEKNNLNLENMDLIVCDNGPGSFTGIRIGIATIKAFHDALNIPCIGVSSLESLSYNTRKIINNNDLVVSIIDCKNHNCYFGLYEKRENNFDNLIEPMAEDIDTALSIIQNYLNDNFSNYQSLNLIFIGSGTIPYEKQIRNIFPNSNFVDSNLNNLNSYSLGLAGLKYYNNNLSPDVLPLYLKKPQAQKQLEEKLSQNKGS